jgi:hypothetical protein
VVWLIKHLSQVFLQQRPHTTWECSGEGYASGVFLIGE